MSDKYTRQHGPHCDFYDLDQSVIKNYKGAGMAVIAVRGGKVIDIEYLDRIERDYSDDENMDYKNEQAAQARLAERAAPGVKILTAMLSCWQACLTEEAYLDVHIIDRHLDAQKAWKADVDRMRVQHVTGLAVVFAKDKDGMYIGCAEKPVPKAINVDSLARLMREAGEVLRKALGSER